MKAALAVAVAAMTLVACSDQASLGKPDHQTHVSSNLVFGQHVHVRKTMNDLHAGAPPAGAHLNYYGGHVIPNVKPVAVFWGPNVNATEQQTMPGFFQTVVNSPYMDWLNEYNTTAGAVDGGTGTNQQIGRGSFGGSYTISPVTDAGTSTNLQDTDVQAELGAQIDNGSLPPPDENTIYFVHFPPGVTINLQGSASCSAFCAYHGTFLRNGQDVYYAVMPDFGPGSPCQNVCGTYPNFMDSFTSAASHELIEAVTDAEVGLATTYGPPLAWMDPTNGEIGDICAYQMNGPLTGSDGTVYNVQGEWSNSRNACTITGAAVNDFSVTPNPASVSINAGASAVVQIQTAVVTGTADSLSLAVSGLPTGVTAAFDTSSITAGGTANLTLTVDPSAASASTYFTLTVQSATVTHQAFISLAINGTATDAGTPDAGTNDFSVALNPSAQTVNAGSSAAFGVDTYLVSGNVESLSLGLYNLPTGVTGTFDQPTIATGGAATLTLSVSSAAAPGTSTFYVYASDGVTVRYAYGSLTVLAVTANDFSVSVTPPSQTVNGGATVTYSVATAVVSGQAQALTLSLMDLPAGINGSFDQSSITAGGSATLTLNVSDAVPAGTYSFAVVGTGASGSHAASASVTINAQYPITFEVDNATTVMGQNVYVVGDNAALGAWNTSKAIKLAPTNYPAWTGSLPSMTPGTVVHFKFIKIDGSGNVVWEGGSDRTLTVPQMALEYVGTWQN